MSEFGRKIFGAVGGATVGIGLSITAVSAAGSVTGLSAAGITSGLAALGFGAMVTGVAVTAAIPCAIGLGGYGLVKGHQSYRRRQK